MTRIVSWSSPLPAEGEGDASVAASSGTAEVDDALLGVLRDAQALGLLGPGPLEPHLAHSLAFARVLVGATGRHAFGPGTVLDLGSGAGLPGLVLATCWPEARFELLDSQHRRAELLADATLRLGLSERVGVLEGRAEDLGRRAELRGSFDAVVARAFARPAVTAECAAPFLRPGGLLVVSEPPPASTPIPSPGGTRWQAEGLDALGMGSAEDREDEFHFVVVRQRAACPDRFPRRVGVPAKRPLF